MSIAPSIPFFGVIIPAAGIGSRMGSSIPKQHMLLCGKPMLVHTLLAFLELPSLQQIVVAVHPEHGEQTVELISAHLNTQQQDKVTFTKGGALRQDSVQAGLQALNPEVKLVLVHDAARPLIDIETILRTVAGAAEHGAVIAALKIKDTIKQVDSSDVIQHTVDREHLWQAQTPQAAQRDLLSRAFDQAATSGFTGTDESSLFEHCAIPVQVVQGHEHNLKITTPGDIALATFLLEQRR